MLLFGFDETDVTLSERAVAVVDLGGQFVRREFFHPVLRFVSRKDSLIADVALHQNAGPDESIKFFFLTLFFFREQSIPETLQYSFRQGCCPAHASR